METNARGIITKAERNRIEASLRPDAVLGDVIYAWLLAQRDATNAANVEVVRGVVNPYADRDGILSSWHKHFEQYRTMFLAALKAEKEVA